ncbi:MAG: flagellar basal body-associated FliL family protein [Acidimicrobiales bacterium]|nr:flagellar basal body-associated FliL family protein [Acidimicrobiales bacterium]
MAKKKAKGDEDAKGGSKKKIIAIVIVAALGYKFMLAPKPKPAEEVAAGEHGAAAAKIEEGGVIAIPDLTLNLAGSDTHYLRVGIALILEKGTSTEHFKEELPIASDVAVDVLSEKTWEQLNEPGSKAELKAELSEKVREAYHDSTVARVIFTSFVMQ